MFRAALDRIRGREQAGTRPVLVVSAEPLNERYYMAMVAPLTSRKSERPTRLGEVMIPSGTAALPIDSFALCYQIRAMGKSRLGRHYGELADGALRDEIGATIFDCFDLPQEDVSSAPEGPR